MKQCKKLAAMTVALILVAATAFCCPVAVAEEQVLNVYNWGVYMDMGNKEDAVADQVVPMDVNEEFEKWYYKTYGETIKVNYSTYENNESMYQKLVAGGAAYDVVVPSDYMVNRLIQENRLEKLDFSNIPNYQYVDQSFKGEDWQYDPTHEYTVPYMWGYVGIVYNTAYVTGAVNSWDVLWDEAYDGKILMFNNARDTFAIALAKNGFDINTTTSVEWKIAYDDLVEQKPLVQGYVTDEIFEKMQSGEAYLAPCYYGDYLVMKANAAEDVDLSFGMITQQASNKFVDSFCIPKGCQNKLAAERYINFMCSYAAGVANANYLGYSSPLTTVEQNQGELYYHYRYDPGVYPSDSVLSAYDEYLYLGEGTQKIMDDYWKDLKKSEGSWIMYVALVVVVAAAIVILLIRRSKQKRIDRMQQRAREKFDRNRKK